LQNPNSPRRSKSLKHKNALTLLSAPSQYSNSAGINYETLGPEELRTLLTTQCGVISEHTKKMCTRSLRCPQHTDEQRRAVRVYLLGPSASLPEAEGAVENDSFEVAESQALMSRLQWDGSSDISPSDSASSKASECTNNSESRKTKKKKPHLGLVSSAPGLSSSKKKKPKPPAPHTPSIYDDIN
ncbi:AT7L3 protein, partial [Cinclus mexicanus]|nr:AT7L3 protein [Cinclus mexicanus]